MEYFLNPMIGLKVMGMSCGGVSNVLILLSDGVHQEGSATLSSFQVYKNLLILRVVECIGIKPIFL